jgi:hypothetical protein
MKYRQALIDKGKGSSSLCICSIFTFKNPLMFYRVPRLSVLNDNVRIKLREILYWKLKSSLNRL